MEKVQANICKKSQILFTWIPLNFVEFEIFEKHLTHRRMDRRTDGPTVDKTILYFYQIKFILEKNVISTIFSCQSFSIFWERDV